MSRKISVFSIVLVVCGLALAADESSIKPMTWGVGYDEGLSGKLFLPLNISVNLSVGYSVIGQSTAKEQPMNSLLLKVGGQYMLKQFGSLRMNVFLDFAEIMNEGQLARKTFEGENLAFYQWSSSIRAGCAPEYFISDHFSLCYKLGVVTTFVGNTFKLNAQESGLEKNNDDHIEGGVLGYNKSSPLDFLQNFSLYFYF
jgi:hypothetical protein